MIAVGIKAVQSGIWQRVSIRKWDPVSNLTVSDSTPQQARVQTGHGQCSLFGWFLGSSYNTAPHLCASWQTGNFSHVSI